MRQGPVKEGIYTVGRELHVYGPRYVAMVANALANETRVRILQYISMKPADLDEIAAAVGQSKANVSSQIRRLESVKLVRSRYVPGNRGIKKIVEPAVERVVIHRSAPSSEGGGEAGGGPE